MILKIGVSIKKKMPTYRQTVVTYPNPTKRFLFVHIPRTAGRFLEENFKENGFEPEQILWKSVDGIEIAHFHNELYQKHFDDLGSIPHFTIVRNPIDRFMSCSIFLTRMYGADIQEAMEDTIMFHSMLEMCVVLLDILLLVLFVDLYLLGMGNQYP